MDRNFIPSSRRTNSRVRRRRTNHVIPQYSVSRRGSPPGGTRRTWLDGNAKTATDFVFMGKDGQFEGYFKTNYNPDEKYDPNHLCEEWDECCTKNLNFKPSQLTEAEQDKKNPLNKKKVKSLEGEMKKLKEILLKNLQDEYETPRQAQSMISMMKTYSWLCNELLRVKYQ